MMNLQDGLAGIAGPAVEPTTQQIAADMARGQRALRRRRLAQAGTGSAFAVAALAAAVAFATTGGATPAQHTPIAQGTTAGSVVAPTVKLVAYTGDQPEGYTLDQVPDGWEVQGVDSYVLTLGPKNAKDKNPQNFVGKVVVMLQSVDETGAPKGEKVDVGGKPGVLGKSEDMTTGWWLYVDQPSGPRLQVQVWDGLGWSKTDVIEFAKGIHVNENAKPGQG
ncbi:hypothetical protein [Actinoplanes derwentensis]|uniref:Uncharacterized protein n=1 Tax=Actinoplanes derwentensis TaxID=113562 RepID=A0A1H2BXH5_9ACTN|nr:hypothetical protein [Actinoplanes derwentensis]GID83155.1 hypothetical protein Ade03nite_20790 [Actinoplanes derwentensis]SDT62496.1 hypothetical protein SAMN04489716_4960 [Actinoplanes derwentensis]